MVTRVAGDQPDEAAPVLVGLRVKGQRGVEVELQESHQPGAALRLLDQRAELLIGGTRRQLGEQRPDIRLADAAEDAVQDVRERPFAGEYVAAQHHVDHLFGCHLFPSSAASAARRRSEPVSETQGAVTVKPR
jgi:hypothetical protein